MDQVVIIILLVGHVLSGPSVQDGADIDFWRATIGEKSIEEIANEVWNPKTHPWPRLSGSDEGLVRLLTTKIVEYERNSRDTVGAGKLEEEVALYLRLSTGALRAGGYFNIVLADSLNRVALGRVLKALGEHSGDPSVAMSLLSIITPGVVPPDQLLEKWLSEGELQTIERALAGSPKNALQTVDLLGGVSPTLEKLQSGAGNTSRLLAKKDLAVLYWRIVETKTMVKVNLPGFIEFLRRGGDPALLDPRDVTPFLAVMGDTRHTYRDDFLGVRSLYPNHLIAIRENLGREWMKAPFFQLAIED